MGEFAKLSEQPQDLRSYPATGAQFEKSPLQMGIRPLPDYAMFMDNAGEAGKKDPDAPEEWNRW